MRNIGQNFSSDYCVRKGMVLFMTKYPNMGKKPNQVEWGREVLRAFALIGKILL